MKVEYYVAVKYNGYDHSIDTKIEKLNPKAHCGAGFCFMTGKRDNSFSVKTYKEALKLATKARKLRKIRGLSKLTARIYRQEY
jgi:hypothetical protein